MVERSGAAIEVHALGQRAIDLLATGMGAMDVGTGRVQVLLMLEHERATRPLKIVFQNGKLNIFDLQTDVAPGRTRLATRCTDPKLHRDLDLPD